MSSTTTALSFATLLMFITIPAYSMQATLKDNTPACLKEKWTADITAYEATRDKVNFDTYINQKKCIIVKSGTAVTVIESPWVFGKFTSFILNDVTYWATTKSFNY